MIWLLAVALGLILLGWFSIGRSKTLRQESGLPRGRLVYADTSSEDWQRNERSLYSTTHHLLGKPDYLVETSQDIIPVEVKSSTAPDLPYLGHLLQLAAYCLLVEETTGHRPPHGLLKYADALYEVDFSPELRRELLETMAAMRAAHATETVHRNHNQVNKCLACGFYDACEEALS